jgi:transposase
LNIQGHKSHDIVSFPLDIPAVKVRSVQQNEQGDYMITVESTQGYAVCPQCGRQTTKFHGYNGWLQLRHLPILGHRVYIRLRPKRYICPHCAGKTITQQLDWYEAKSPHTKAYDRYLIVQLINSTVQDVSRKEDVGYEAVNGAIERHIDTRVNWDEFSELSVIGIDEIALTKGRRNFIAILTTQQADGHIAVLTVLPDRSKTSVRQFLETIPPRLRPTLHTVCTDMWDGYVKAVQEFATNHLDVEIKVIVDRFHVAKNYRDCVDKVRKQECRRLKKVLAPTDYAEIVQGTLWLVRQNHKDLTPDDRQKLRRLFTYAPQLKLAYTFREELTAIFEMPLTAAQARTRLLKWAAKVSCSALTGFDTFLTTLHNWLDEIVNYFVNRLSSGFVEGLNNKIKTIKRRCYGITRVITLFQRLYLDLEGYRRFA